MDITGAPRDGYYLYQSLWTDEPVLHLFPHWNWPGRAGQTIPVLAYTNCNIVELFLNGRSLGENRLELPAQGTSGSWNTYAQPVVLRATGKRRDGTVACHAEVRTAGPPAAIRLSVERDTISTGAGDVAQVRFEIVDSAGTVVPTAGNLVRFTIKGGSILALDNSDPRGHDPYRSDRRRACDGRGLAIVSASRPGSIHLTASGDGLRPARDTLQVMQGDRPGAVPTGAENDAVPRFAREVPPLRRLSAVPPVRLSAYSSPCPAPVTSRWRACPTPASPRSSTGSSGCTSPS